jgi:hypothetical protein
MKQRIAVLSFLAVFALSDMPVAAEGLTLYSYRDSRGQLIIVDSPEKIPPEYQDQIETGYIPTFSSVNPEKKSAVDQEPAAIVSTDDEQHGQTLEEHYDKPAGAVSVSAPPPEIPVLNPAVATAAALLAQFQNIHLNYERLHLQAKIKGTSHPVVRHLHLTNIQAIQEIIAPESIDWARAASWKEKAAVFMKQVKTLQFTVSHWLNTSPAMLIKALPALLINDKNLLIELEKEFYRLEKEEKDSL